MLDSESQTERLQKYIAERGMCSRRHAEEAIAAGMVTVNGKVAILGQKVDPLHDEVVFYGETISKKKLPKKIVLALHKPRGYLCSNSDPFHGETVFDLLPLYRQYKLFCCGRLDKDSEGLLILTNDGNLAQRLSHPSRGVTKYYHVILDKPFQSSYIAILKSGIEDEGDLLRVKEITFPSKDRHWIEVQLEEGKKRHIRRQMAALGYRVERLIRVKIGDFALENLKPGKYLELKEKHIAKLFV